MRKLPKAARAAGRERAPQDPPPLKIVDENASTRFSPAAMELQPPEPVGLAAWGARGVDKPEGI